MKSSDTTPIIVAFIANDTLTTKLTQAASQLAYRIQWIKTAVQLGPNTHPHANQPGECLTGQKGKLFEKITAWQPALLLFDLTNPNIPWQQWIPALTSSAATRRLPILSLAPNTLQKEAQRIGSDHVLPHAQFTANIAQTLQQYARIPPYAALKTWCAEPLPQLVQEGIALFNQGEYYKCHNALEQAWRTDDEAGRNLYKGILQVGVAYLQIERGNYRGAVKILLRARQWLSPLPDVCRGIHIRALQNDMEQVYAQLAALGAENIAQFDHTLCKPIQLE